MYVRMNHHRASLVVQVVKNLPAMQDTWVQSVGWEDPLEKGMTTHSSILAWRIPWTEEPGGLQSMGSQRAGHDWVTDIYMNHRKILLKCGFWFKMWFLSGAWGSAFLTSSQVMLMLTTEHTLNSKVYEPWEMRRFWVGVEDLPTRAKWHEKGKSDGFGDKNKIRLGLEKVSFHSNPKERQFQRMLKLPHNCTHLTR